MIYGYAPLSAHPFEALGVNFDYTMARSDVDIPVSPAPAAEFRREELLSPVRFEEYEAFNGALVLADQFWAKDALQQMEREYRTRRNHCVQRLRGQMLCLLCDIARAQDTPAQLTDEVCDSLLDYIHAHFREPLTNESLSRVFSFHPAYLSRIVKRQTGMPLHRYLLRYRLSAAMNLLQTTRLPVSEVAAQSGFPDSNYFSRSFKQQWGGSPGDFRGGV
jgi:AraC-like DNA-binding protein